MATFTLSASFDLWASQAKLTTVYGKKSFLPCMKLKTKQNVLSRHNRSWLAYFLLQNWRWNKSNALFCSVTLLILDSSLFNVINSSKMNNLKTIQEFSRTPGNIQGQQDIFQESRTKRVLIANSRTILGAQGRLATKGVRKGGLGLTPPH